MKIAKLYKPNKTVISFEIFPPKKEDGLESVYDTLRDLTCLKPDYISVTYGAGGSGGGGGVTADIAKRIKAYHDAEALAHLTCAHINENNIAGVADAFKERGIENILALRGDQLSLGGFKYAKELIAALKKYGFCIGAAAYPEGHINCERQEDDINYMKEKEEAGADFFITQLFFDNEVYYRFLEKTRKAGITAPISAGIMPILSKAQISRMIFMCGASLPAPIIKLLNKYGEEGESLVKAGVAYSFKQMQNLCENDVDGAHIYTMNKPFIAKYCMENLSVKRIKG
jgi:methylenetetrahydrofolate reductase (NADPH)